jgi:TatD DNase family protein
MDKIVDIHTHSRQKHGISIVNIFAQDSDDTQNFIEPVSLGIHPWHLNEIKTEKELQKMSILARNSGVYAIGECGLDRAISINFDKQLDVFLAQNQIAIEHDLPLIIHSVKTYSDFLNLMKNQIAKTSWIFHGFRGNYQIAKKLIDNGAFISLGSIITKEDSKTIEVVKKIPLQRLFLETDNEEIDIIDIYKKAAEIRGIPLNEFINHIYQNFIYCFNYGIR